MEKDIDCIYRKDITAIWISTVSMWLAIGLILGNVISLADTFAARAVLSVSSLFVVTSLSLTSFALIRHLRRHKEELYTEDIMHSRNAKKAA